MRAPSDKPKQIIPLDIDLEYFKTWDPAREARHHPDYFKDALEEIAATLVDLTNKLFPTDQHTQARSSVMAGVLLTIALKYAHQSGANMIEWLQAQIDTNLKANEAYKRARDVQNN